MSAAANIDDIMASPPAEGEIRVGPSHQVNDSYVRNLTDIMVTN